MRNAILLMLLAVVSSSAATEWVGVSDNETATYYADPATIRRKDDVVKMWVLNDYKKPQVTVGRKLYMSARTRDQYDCKEERTRVLNFSFHSGNMGTGEVVTSESEPGAWNPVAPGTVGEQLWQLACGKR